MGLFCPPKCEAQQRQENLNKLRVVVDQMMQNDSKVPVHMCPPPVCCGGCCQPPPPCPPPQPSSGACKPPEIMVCYRIQKKADAPSTEEKGAGVKGDEIKVKPCKSRELRGGILYSGCSCEKRDGLQDDCLRKECQGRPECLARPPTCCPSQFSNGKHLLTKIAKYQKVRERAAKGNDDDHSAGGAGSGGAGGAKDDDFEYACFPAKIM